MQFLHPIFHSNSYQAGSRIDIDRELPPLLEDEDLDYFLDTLSEQPQYIDRIAPVTAQIGEEIINGKNWTDLMAKSYRVFTRMLSNIAAYIHQTLIDNFKEKGMVPFLSLAVDPDTIRRIIDIDYETGESSYIRLLNLYSSGVVSPCITVPFHTLLPLLDHDHDIRILVRIGILLYWNIIIDYHKHLRENLGDKDFMVVFWLPEGGYSRRVIDIIHEEIAAKCKQEKIRNPHLVFLLDNEQALDDSSDILMKSWNLINLNKKETASVVFKNRLFSDWINRATPSVKKLIDRTIAKNDAELNDELIHYCWAHFENIEALARTSKSVENFEQKIIKLTELGYLSLSPDMFIRRKSKEIFQSAPTEPRKIEIKEKTGWLDWHPHNISLGRWEGILDSNVEYKLVDENRPYQRITSEGRQEELGPQCWKVAFNCAMKNCSDAIKGDPAKFNTGMLGVLASLIPTKDKKIIHRNVDDFLVKYAYIHWREHFLHQGVSEPDIYISELVENVLFKDTGEVPDPEECVIAALAAQAYYFAFDARTSLATAWENFDQRATYQSSVMATLALVNAIYIYRWQGKKDDEKKIFNVLKTELLDFHNGYERYKLAQYGVTLDEWEDAIKSHIEESDQNVVERAAYRIAARNLRTLGYRKEFTREHENLTCNTGHIWSSEIEHANFKWENTLFCGIREE